MAQGYWTEVEARGVLSALEKSKLSVVEFAHQRGITPQRIYWWQKKLAGKASRKSTALALLPIRVTGGEPRRGEPVTVLLRTGQMLKVGRGFDEEAFARVIAVLEGV